MTLEEIHEALWAAALEISGPEAAAYDGVVPATPVGNYFVLYMTPSRAVSTRVGWHATDVSATFQISCVSRNSPRALAATVDKVRAKFTGLLLGEGPNAPRCKENGTPSAPPTNQSVPGDIRWWMPMPYRVDTSI